MGSETSGGIRNVEVRGCIAEADNWAPIRFMSQPRRGGVVEKITYRDLELSGVRQAVEFNMAWRMAPPLAPPASCIDGITYENCEVTADTGLKIENARHVATAGLKIIAQTGKPVIRR